MIVTRILARARHVFALGLFALAVGSVTGCAVEEPAPTFTPRTLPSSETQSAPESDEGSDPSRVKGVELVAPMIPAENQDFDLNGAEATARYYLEAFEYGYASLDSGPLERISTSNCKTCAKHIRKINVFKTEGKTLQGGEITVDELVEYHENDEKAVITISATQEPLIIHDASNAVISTDPGGMANMSFFLRYQSEMWRIEAVAADVQGT